MAKLLVSVRSGAEASAALAGGASIIDVKDPLHGSLGRSPISVWRDVRQVVPRHIPISVALGELTDWMASNTVEITLATWKGLAYCKLGLSNAPPDWIDRWRDLRQRLVQSRSSNPAWVAVVYVDWHAAARPLPRRSSMRPSRSNGAVACCSIRGTSQSIEVLILTGSHTSTGCAARGESWRWPARSMSRRSCGWLHSQPDIFAVRGSACTGGDRLGPIDPECVSALSPRGGVSSRIASKKGRAWLTGLGPSRETQIIDRDRTVPPGPAAARCRS